MDTFEKEPFCDCFDMDYVPVIISKFKKFLGKSQSDILWNAGLKGVHTLYLICLYKNAGGMTQKEMTERLGVDKANTTRAVRELIEKRCVCRVREEAQRNVKLTLTARGKAVAEKLDENAKQFHALIFSALTPEEKETVKHVLFKVDALLTQANESALKSEKSKNI